MKPNHRRFAVRPSIEPPNSRPTFKEVVCCERRRASPDAPARRCSILHRMTYSASGVFPLVCEKLCRTLLLRASFLSLKPIKGKLAPGSPPVGCEGLRRAERAPCRRCSGRCSEPTWRPRRINRRSGQAAHDPGRGWVSAGRSGTVGGCSDRRRRGSTQGASTLDEDPGGSRGRTYAGRSSLTDRTEEPSDGDRRGAFAAADRRARPERDRRDIGRRIARPYVVVGGLPCSWR